jgi:hypothetical protein
LFRGVAEAAGRYSAERHKAIGREETRKEYIEERLNRVTEEE